MFVRKFIIVVHGENKFGATATTATTNVVHWRAFWKGKPSEAGINQAVEGSIERFEWKNAICVNVSEIGGVWLWDVPEDVTPLGYSKKLLSIAREAKADNERDTAKAKAFIRRVTSWFKRLRGKAKRYEEGNYD